jgi:hypothetical protein
MLINFFLFFNFIQLTLQIEIINQYNNNLSGNLFRKERMIICSLFFFVLFEVIFNLIDIPLFIDHGWIPVNSTSNITLTENLLSTLDIVEHNITNLTNLAVRTPLPFNYPTSTILPIKLNRKFKNVSGINFHIIFIL